jgi:hypothetical protein
MNPNDHFDIDAWVNHARGLGSPEQRSAMQDHAHSCVACSETLGFLSKFWAIGKDMAKDALPEEWSTKAEQIFRNRVLQPIQLLPAQAAILAFDSLNAATPQHVRAHSSTGRHMVYHAADCAIDLKLDDSLRPNDVSIIGQISDRRSPDRAITNTPVFLLTGKKILASTFSNQFGEFRLICRPKRNMLISFPFDGSRIDVTLDPLLDEESRQS